MLQLHEIMSKKTLSKKMEETTRKKEKTNETLDISRVIKEDEGCILPSDKNFMFLGISVPI